MRLSTRSLFRAALLFASSVAILNAGLVYQGGQGGTSYGVAQYGGAPNNGGATYLANNFYNTQGIGARADILTSPGGGFLTANPVVVNNIASTGVVGLPLATWVAGVSNVNGTIGLAASTITGPTVGFALTDANADGTGVASYLISSWRADFQWQGAAVVNGFFTNFLAASGAFSSPLSAAAVGLRTVIYVNNVFFVDLPELVIGARTANGFFTGTAGAYNGNAAVFNALALGRAGFGVNLNNGDSVRAYSTLTAIADPASLGVDSSADFSSYFQSGDIGVNELADVQIPEPGTIAFLVSGLGLLVWKRRSSLSV